MTKIATKTSFEGAAETAALRLLFCRGRCRCRYRYRPSYAWSLGMLLLERSPSSPAPDYTGSSVDLSAGPGILLFVPKVMVSYPAGRYITTERSCVSLQAGLASVDCCTHSSALGIQQITCNVHEFSCFCGCYSQFSAGYARGPCARRPLVYGECRGVAPAAVSLYTCRLSVCTQIRLRVCSVCTAVASPATGTGVGWCLGKHDCIVTGDYDKVSAGS